VLAGFGKISGSGRKKFCLLIGRAEICERRLGLFIGRYKFRYFDLLKRKPFEEGDLLVKLILIKRLDVENCLFGLSAVYDYCIFEIKFNDEGHPFIAGNFVKRRFICKIELSCFDSMDSCAGKSGNVASTVVCAGLYIDRKFLLIIGEFKKAVADIIIRGERSGAARHFASICAACIGCIFAIVNKGAVFVNPRERRAELCSFIKFQTVVSIGHNMTP